VIDLMANNSVHTKDEEGGSGEVMDIDVEEGR